MSLAYRPEIDGLRAVAVLAVILFHAGFARLSGGFLGVDVFFVISGYLITALIRQDIARGTFSFLAFYERRARRILPALLVMVAGCLPFAWAFMSAEELKAFAASVVSVCLFASNLLFWSESDYFARAAELKPLLHTWTLAVEEQFYLLYPAVLVLLAPFGRRAMIAGLLLMALVSLGLNWLAQRHDPAAAFFLLPMRGWELAAGGLCAFAALSPRAGRDNLLSAAGLVAILVPLFAMKGSMGSAALLASAPVAGTCLFLLFANRGTLAHGVLSLRPLVGVGLVSYSAYLWHQPLFAFARIRLADAPGRPMMLGLCVLALALGWLSWRFVERPVRARGVKSWPGRRSFFTATAAAAGLLTASGFGIYAADGVPARWPEEVNRLSAALTPNTGLSPACDAASGIDLRCVSGPAPSVLVWGDSQAMQLVDALRAARPGLAVAQMTQSLCGPFLGIGPLRPDRGTDWPAQCIAFNDAVLAFVRQTPTLKFAVLSSAFEQYVNNAPAAQLRDGAVVPARSMAEGAFRATLRALTARGITPVVVSPVPRSADDAGLCLLRARQFGRDAARCNFSLDRAWQRQAAVRRFLTEIGQEVQVVWPDAELCPQGLCAAGRDGLAIYRDDAHLSREGSRALGLMPGFAAQLPENGL